MKAPRQSEATVFEIALQYADSQERAAYLDGACEGEPELRRRVEELLTNYSEAGAFMEASPGANQLDSTPAGTVVVTDSPLKEKPGDTIGRYKLLEKIGEGGFGVVYVAEQREPVKRRVALKIIKLGMDTREVVARFEVERQALAMMDHPNIARVFDAGATETGRPFFVMELVRGVPITEYCDQNHLPTPQRLELFVKVCNAIQHAHQKGVIHRDIKPSNILVTLHDGAPVPKVIDFGIAKATEARLTDKTVYTQFQQFMGTPAYISPEQAEMSGLDVDTRSDIYSLGVLLYELLTGTTPFDARQLMASGLDHMRRAIREHEPAPPSTRLRALGDFELTRTARRQSAEPGRLINLLRGELDWIVMKAMEKDRTRRYETANGLALDVQRYQRKEPVTARPPSMGYLFKKAVQRHKVAVVTAGVITLTLLAGILVSSWSALVATRAQKTAVAERTKAEAEAQKSRQLAQSMQNMLKGIGPGAALGRDTTLLREILDQTVERLPKDLAGQPEVEAELRLTIGQAYYDLGQFTQAERMYREALQLSRSATGPESVAVANELVALGWVLARGRDLRQAESVLREALAMAKKVHGDAHPTIADSLSHLGDVLRTQGRLAEAETATREALAMRRKLFGEEHLDVATSLNNLGLVLQAQGKPSDAESVHRAALAMRRKLLGDVHLAVATSLNNLATVLRLQARFPEAESTSREALAMRRKLLGNEHPVIAASLNELALALRAQGRLAEAESIQREALAMRRKLLGEEHPDVAASLDNLAIVLTDENKLVEAEDMSRQALAMRRKLLGDEHPDVATSLMRLAVVFREQGRLTEAERAGRDALAMRRKLFGDEHPEVAASLNLLAAVLGQEDKLAEAEAMSREALALRQKLLGTEHPDVAVSHRNLAFVLRREDKLAAAEPHLLEALKIRQAGHPPVPQEIRAVMVGLIDLYTQWTGSDATKGALATDWRQKLKEFDQAEATRKVAGKPSTE